MIPVIASAAGRHRRLRRGGMFSAFLIGLGASLVITMLLAVLIGSLSESSTDARTPEQQVADQIDALLATIADGTYASAYQTMCSPQLREGTSLKDWCDCWKAWKNDFGALKSKRQTQYQRHPRKDLYLVRVQYDAEFEKGPAQVTAQLMNVDNRWVFEVLHIQKPKAEKK
jgi:hypothetical protein